MANLKDSFKKVLPWLGFAVALFFPFVAGICCKEGATNGFETFTGWVVMLEVVALIVIAILRHRKK